MPKMLELKNAGPSAQDLLAEFEANQHKLKGVRVGSRLAVGPTEKSFTLIGTEAGLDFLPYSTGYQGAHDGLCLLYDPEQNRVIVFDRAKEIGLVDRQSNRCIPFPMPAGMYGKDTTGKYDGALLLARYDTARELFPAVNLMENNPALLWTTSKEPIKATVYQPALA